MSNLTALQQAKWMFEHRDSSDRQTKVDSVVALAQWRLFSNAQLSKITGLKEREVAAFTKKTDRTGGTFEPEALGPCIEIIKLWARGLRDDRPIHAALRHTSTRMVARLTGLTQSYVTRAARRAVAM